MHLEEEISPPEWAESIRFVYLLANVSWS